MKKLIKNFIHSIVFEIVNDLRDEMYTAYSLIEDGEFIDSIEMKHKPSKSDVINNTDEPHNKYKFLVEKVELSDTGFTGKIYGKKIAPE